MNDWRSHLIDPLQEYTARLAARQTWMDQCRRKIRLVAYIRLGIGAVIAVMIWMAFVLHWLSGWMIIPPVIIFFALMSYHDRLFRQGRQATRAVSFYERGMARLQDRWMGLGNTETSFASEYHLYAEDLDLFGKGSLFELLCAARTRSGERVLADWLCRPADRDEILARQSAAVELRDNVNLREDLSVLADDVRHAVNPEFLKSWSERPPSLHSKLWRATAPLLVFLVLFGAGYWWLSGDSRLFFVGVLLEIVYGWSHRSKVIEVNNSVDEPAQELHVLYYALDRISREGFQSAKLQDLRSRIEATGKHASREIAVFLRLVELLNYRRNQFFAIFGFLLLWTTQLSYAIESWRRRCGPDLHRWLEAVGEVEALCSLAGYSFENPTDPFPEIVKSGAIVEADSICHPLLPRSQCVPNSLALGETLRLLIVSGSNMSGKSTLLRTVGINVVLAQAGGPVRASRMRISVCEVGATLRVQDSLQAGASRFYAEIKRLHDVMELTKGPRPVLFLFDEILHGTNSHDRAIGAEAVVRGLVERGAIGLVTTHDLALAHVADAMTPQAANVHFEDHLEGGRMIFDYQLRPGVVRKSNALELMRAVGLNV